LCPTTLKEDTTDFRHSEPVPSVAERQSEESPSVG